MSETLGDPEEHWPVHATETVWDGGAPFSVRKDTISAPADPEETFGRVVLEHPGAVVVLAVDDRERVLVLHQYRHPVGRRMLELPAGLLDEPGEDPEEAARRELREEGLLEADHWEHLLSTYTSPGITSERIEIFAATGLRAAPDRGGFTPAHEEADMTSSWVPLDDLLAAFLERRITNGPTGHALMAWALRRGR
ncbi:NUDIX domain-containing protein [Nocardioides iriomotensis]|uniref:NUDIX hydrolase n=1 Tax=Nocardioides iriomotensis TaxID=715784 RepID=A0A4Q5IYJ4_9ACTN|nr:NUDIX hydrolase [Nocardioides iriomotensis]RYU11134.1 NUDIX hydrolase [Nocardioides iriomotensis]